MHEQVPLPSKCLSCSCRLPNNLTFRFSGYPTKSSTPTTNVCYYNKVGFFTTKQQITRE